MIMTRFNSREIVFTQLPILFACYLPKFRKMIKCVMFAFNCIFVHEPCQFDYRF